MTAAALRRAAAAVLAAALLSAAWTGPAAARGDGVAPPLEAAARLIARTHIDRPPRAAIPTDDPAAFTDWLRRLDPYAHLDPAPPPAGEDTPRLGVVVLDDRGEAPPLVLPLAGGPAARAGLTHPVRLLAVDGETTAGAAGTAELARRTAAGAALVLKVRPAGDPDAAPRHVAVVPGPHDPPLVERITLGDRRIVRLHRFIDGRTRHALAEALDWAKAGGGPVVLDVRWATGGHLLEAIDSISLFLPRRVPVASAVRAGDDRLTYTSRDDWHRVDAPVIALTGPYTASSAEVLVRALAHYGWAITAGHATYGKCVFQERHPLPGGAAITLTVGKLLDPAGGFCDGRGLAPHLPLTAPTDDLPGLLADLDTALDGVARVCREDLFRPDAVDAAARALGWTEGVGRLTPVVLKRDTRRRLCLAPVLKRAVADAVARDQATRAGRPMATETAAGDRVAIVMPDPDAAPAPAEPGAEAVPSADPVTTAAPDTAPATGYGVRVGSFRDPGNAARAARTLREDRSALLGDHTVVSRQVDLGDKGAWLRVYVVRFGTRPEARAFCARMGHNDCTGIRVCRIPERGTTQPNAC